jgi:hypothetical protein
VHGSAVAHWCACAVQQLTLQHVLSQGGVMAAVLAAMQRAGMLLGDVPLFKFVLFFGSVVTNHPRHAAAFQNKVEVSLLAAEQRLLLHPAQQACPHAVHGMVRWQAKQEPAEPGVGGPEHAVAACQTKACP